MIVNVLIAASVMEIAKPVRNITEKPNPALIAEKTGMKKDKGVKSNDYPENTCSNDMVSPGRTVTFTLSLYL